MAEAIQVFSNVLECKRAEIATTWLVSSLDAPEFVISAITSERSEAEELLPPGLSISGVLCHAEDAAVAQTSASKALGAADGCSLCLCLLPESQLQAFRLAEGKLTSVPCKVVPSARVETLGCLAFRLQLTHKAFLPVEGDDGAYSLEALCRDLSALEASLSAAGTYFRFAPGGEMAPVLVPAREEDGDIAGLLDTPCGEALTLVSSAEDTEAVATAATKRAGAVLPVTIMQDLSVGEERAAAAPLLTFERIPGESQVEQFTVCFDVVAYAGLSAPLLTVLERLITGFRRQIAAVQRSVQQQQQRSTSSNDGIDWAVVTRGNRTWCHFQPERLPHVVSLLLPLPVYARTGIIGADGKGRDGF